MNRIVYSGEDNHLACVGLQCRTEDFGERFKDGRLGNTPREKAVYEFVQSLVSAMGRDSDDSFRE